MDVKTLIQQTNQKVNEGVTVFKDKTEKSLPEMCSRNKGSFLSPHTDKFSYLKKNGHRNIFVTKSS